MITQAVILFFLTITIDCGLCPEIAPSIFKRNDEGGYSYVYHQPQTAEEWAKAREAIESCPTESIGEVTN